MFERIFVRRGVPRWKTDGYGAPMMADDPKDKPKTNGQGEDDEDSTDEPWPDDNVPRPPFMPPPDQPSPNTRSLNSRLLANFGRIDNVSYSPVAAVT